MFSADPEHQRPNFDGCIYIHYVALPHLSRILLNYVLQSSVGLHLLTCACNA